METLYKKHPRFKHLFVGSNGDIFSLKTNKFLNPTKTSKGYLQIFVLRSSYRVHRLVTEAFFGLSDLQVDHKNGIKTDNSLNNLEYVSNRENFDRSVKSGLRTWSHQKGEGSNTNKLSESIVLNILKNPPKTISEKKDLAEILGVSCCTINDILKRRSWKHLSI